jgi:hypothetical protein
MVGATEEPSTVQILGVLGILGNEHEISIPVHVDLEAADHWDLTSHFDVPYAKWGSNKIQNWPISSLAL